MGFFWKVKIMSNLSELHLSHNPCVVYLHSKMLRSLQISKSSTSTLSCLLVPVVAMTKGTFYFLSTIFTSISPSSLFMISTPHLWFLCFAISNTRLMFMIHSYLHSWNMHIWNAFMKPNQSICKYIFFCNIV